MAKCLLRTLMASKRACLDLAWLMQKYTIRDLTTGQLFVVDAEPTAQPATLSEPGSPVKEGQCT